MRKTLLLFTTFCATQIFTFAQCPPDLSYAGYHEIFRDDFNYTPATFKTDPAFTALWELPGGGICDGWGKENFHESKVSMLSTGTIRFTENVIPAFTCSRWGNTVTINHTSGMLATRKPNYVGIGIIEANIKIPARQNPQSESAWPAFWVIWGKDWSGGKRQYTEIDIIDNSDGSDVGVENNIYFTHTWAPNSEVQRTEHFTTLAAPCQTPVTLSEDFHVYSCLWTPSRVTFYVDRKYVHHMDFDKNSDAARTYPDFQNLLITLQTQSGTKDGLTMDVDWVRYMAQDCDVNDFVIDPANTHPTMMNYPDLPPDFNKVPQFNMLKHKNILVNNAWLPPVKPQENLATVWEAQSTTILPNFVADQKSVVWGPVNTRNGVANVPLSGYFEIRSMYCGMDSHEWFKTGPGTHSDNEDKNWPYLNKRLPATHIYPNPSNGNFVIETPEAVEYELNIINMYGATVYKTHVDAVQKHEIHLGDNLPPGIYHVHLAGKSINFTSDISIVK